MWSSPTWNTWESKWKSLGTWSRSGAGLVFCQRSRYCCRGHRGFVCSSDPGSAGKNSKIVVIFHCFKKSGIAEQTWELKLGSASVWQTRELEIIRIISFISALLYFYPTLFLHEFTLSFTVTKTVGEECFIKTQPWSTGRVSSRLLVVYFSFFSGETCPNPPGLRCRRALLPATPTFAVT